jgi:hypothetical protein
MLRGNRMANNDDSNDYERKTYYTNIPGWAAAQVEDYIDETGFSNSKAVSKLVQKGLQEQTLAEQITRQLITIPLSSLAILIMMYFWAAVGGIIGIAVPIDTTTATVYAWVIGPSMVSITVIAASLMYTGYAKKIGWKIGKLGIFNTTAKPDSD